MENGQTAKRFGRFVIYVPRGRFGRLIKRGSIVAVNLGPRPANVHATADGDGHRYWSGHELRTDIGMDWISGTRARTRASHGHRASTDVGKVTDRVAATAWVRVWESQRLHLTVWKF